MQLIFRSALKNASLYLLLAALPGSRALGATVYTDQSSFLADVAPGYYLETFEELPSPGNLATVVNFSSNGYSYMGVASGGPYDNASFYAAYTGHNPNVDVYLSVNEPTVQMEFDFSPNVTAIGGTFFMYDGRDVEIGAMYLTLADGTQIVFNGYTPFYGFTSPLPITSLTVTGDRTSTINNFYAGSSLEAVPEPGTMALIGTGIALILFGRVGRAGRIVAARWGVRPPRLAMMTVLIVGMAAVPAGATTVYFQGTFDTALKGTLDGGTFSGSFDITFPIPATFKSLTTYDVVMQQGSFLVEIKNGQFKSFGEVFGNLEVSNGGLAFQFIDVANDFLVLYFTVPFNGVAPVLLRTAQNFISDARVTGGGDSAVKSGFASTTALPEAATWLPCGAGLLGLLAVRRVTAKIPGGKLTP